MNRGGFGQRFDAGETAFMTGNDVLNGSRYQEIFLF